MKFNNFIHSYQNRVGPITANKRLENLEIVWVRLSVPVSKQAPKKNKDMMEVEATMTITPVFIEPMPMPIFENSNIQDEGMGDMQGDETLIIITPVED